VLSEARIVSFEVRIVAASRISVTSSNTSQNNHRHCNQSASTNSIPYKVQTARY